MAKNKINVRLNNNPLHIFCVFIIILNNLGETKKVSMKIVEEPSNYGVNNYQAAPSEAEALKMRIQPANFSGPPHLRALMGKCFSTINNDYKYELCPFVNVTQHEQSLRWNPYSGVLGVWQDWVIENNTFTAMMMREGDSCGAKYRTVKVEFECGATESIGAVSEPETCHYVLAFTTRYVCHPHAMLVYPTLPPTLQRAWDAVEGRWLNGLLTKQGYDRELRLIFEEAGLQIPQAEKDKIADDALKKQKQVKDETQFESLDTCKDEYKKLKEELDGVRALLEVYERNNPGNGGNDGMYDGDYGNHFRYDGDIM